MNNAIFHEYIRIVDVKLIHIESDWRFLSPYQTADEPKERTT